MQNHEYGFASTRPSKLQNSFIRPQSQQRSSSMSHEESLKKNSYSKLDVNRHSMQVSPANEYYVSEWINGTRRPFGQYCRGNLLNSKMMREQSQNIEKSRKIFLQKLQKWMLDLRQQIHKQSNQIFNLQKLIEQQNKQIQSKNHLIQSLVAKLTRQNRSQINNEKYSTMNIRRIQDLQTKIKTLADQFYEEKEEMSNKIQKLTCEIIRYFGKQFWKMKGVIFHFMKDKQRAFQQIDKRITKLHVDIDFKIMGMQKNIGIIQTGLKNITDDSFYKDNQTTNTKDTLQFCSYKSDALQLFKKEENIFSDYLFYPQDKQVTNMKTIELLVQDREELPIRVFLDVSGRLKYWQSRTFIFDRRGNFTAPTIGELAMMEQRGWIKIIAND